MNKNAKIGEVSDILGVTYQTIRNWLKIGDEFFTSNATRKTGKRFTPQDIEQLQRIKSHLADGLRYEDIPARLPIPEVIEIMEDTTDTPPEAPGTPQDHGNAIQTLELMEYIERLLDQQRETHQDTLHAKDETIQVLQSENERLRSELERSRRPWWRRR